MTRPTSRRRGERGSASVEAAVAVPAFALFVGLILFGGRTTIARQAVESAASEAARTASLTRSAGAAEAAATQVAKSSLANQDVDCVEVNINVDTSGFLASVGDNTVVTVSVECLLDLSDLAVPGVPGKRKVKATMSSPLDTWRERS